MLALGIDEGAALNKPQRSDARNLAQNMPAPEADGELYSFHEGLKAFDAFGVEVSSYMRFLTYTGSVTSGESLGLTGGRAPSRTRARRAVGGDHAHSALAKVLAAQGLNGRVEGAHFHIFVGFVFWMREQLLRRRAEVSARALQRSRPRARGPMARAPCLHRLPPRRDRQSEWRTASSSSSNFSVSLASGRALAEPRRGGRRRTIRILARWCTSSSRWTIASSSTR